jgi:hypothetical protein
MGEILDQLSPDEMSLLKRFYFRAGAVRELAPHFGYIGLTSIDKVIANLEVDGEPRRWAYQCNENAARSLLSKLMKVRGYESE